LSIFHGTTIKIVGTIIADSSYFVRPFGEAVWDFMVGRKLINFLIEITFEVWESYLKSKIQ